MYVHYTAQFLGRVTKLKRSGTSSEERGLQTTAPTTQLCQKSSSFFFSWTSYAWTHSYLSAELSLGFGWIQGVPLSTTCWLKGTCSPTLCLALPTLQVTFNTCFRAVYEGYDRVILFEKKKVILYAGLAHNLSFPKVQVKFDKPTLALKNLLKGPHGWNNKAWGTVGCHVSPSSTQIWS